MEIVRKSAWVFLRADPTPPGEFSLARQHRFVAMSFLRKLARPSNFSELLYTNVPFNTRLTMEYIQKESPRVSSSSVVEKLILPMSRSIRGGGYDPLVRHDVERDAHDLCWITQDEFRAVLSPSTFREDDAILLGVLDGEPRSTACFAFEVDDWDGSATFSAQFRSARSVAPLLDARWTGVLAKARALMHWRAQQRFCGVCGSDMHPEELGRSRACSSCGNVVYPVTNPCVIMLVEHEGKALLGRQHSWAKHRYSTLAGFVEPGETLEEAVKREVYEETGVDVCTTDLRYEGSQPWPFPSSLMVAFSGTARSDEIMLNRSEMEDARWFSAREVDDMLFATGEGRIGDLHGPMPSSISHYLLHRWLDRVQPVAL